MTCLVVGGSAGLGRALAERFARAGQAVVLVSSDERDGRAVAADLSLRHGVAARAVTVELSAATLDIATIEAALVGLPPLATLLLAAGANRDEDLPGQDAAVLASIHRMNYLAPCQLVDHFLPILRASEHGLVVGFGSIAGIRGRTRNIAYSAAKRALDSHFESLRHALVGSSVIAQFYVLGYLDTNLAFAQKTALPRAAPWQCADRVFRNRGRDFGRAYHPGYWRLVGSVLRQLPWFVYRRMSF